MTIQQSFYDGRTWAMMGRAFNSALKDLSYSGVPAPRAIRSAIAAAILTAVDEGERDANHLLRRALNAANGIGARTAADEVLEPIRPPADWQIH